MTPPTKTVAQCNLNGKIVKRFTGTRVASDAMGVSSRVIALCCRENSQCKGFLWKYDPDYDIENFFQKFYKQGGKTVDICSNYIIFPDGRLYSKFTHNYLQPSIHRDDYLSVMLYMDNEKRAGKLVHVLVAQNFIPPVDGATKVNHKDGNKTNNHVDNLEWLTSSGNTQHAHDTGLIKKYTKSVVQYTKDGDYVNTYPSLKEAAFAMGVTKGSICDACRGKYKTCKGYVFKLQDEKIVKDNPDEIWKEIKEYPHHEISNLGRVYSQKTDQIRKILNRKGRQTITIDQDSLLIHALVGEAFLKSPSLRNL